jgi:hypothetical protein
MEKRNMCCKPMAKFGSASGITVDLVAALLVWYAREQSKAHPCMSSRLIAVKETRRQPTDQLEDLN